MFTENETDAAVSSLLTLQYRGHGSLVCSLWEMYWVPKTVSTDIEGGHPCDTRWRRFSLPNNEKLSAFKGRKSLKVKLKEN